MGQRSAIRKGWGEASGGIIPPSILADLPTGLLAMSGDLVVPQAPAWSGATFFTVAGLFNNVGIIKNNGNGVIEVLQDGLYMLYGYGTNKNTQASSELNIRFTANGVLIPNSQHQIFEFATDQDRDMISKGVPVVLSSGDLVKCEFNSNQDATTLMGDATWMIQLSTGVKGIQGPSGPSSMSTDEFSVYRSLNPSGQDLTIDRNVFWKQGTSPNDIEGSAGGTTISQYLTGAVDFLTNVLVGDVIYYYDGVSANYLTVASVTDNLNLETIETIPITFSGRAWEIYQLPADVTAKYNVNGKFDVLTGNWSPDAGKYSVSAEVGFGEIGDSGWAYCYLKNITTGLIVSNGGRGRNEGNGQFNSVLSCQISANGTDKFALWCVSSDTTCEIKGIDSYKTYFMAHKISDTP